MYSFNQYITVIQSHTKKLKIIIQYKGIVYTVGKGERWYLKRGDSGKSGALNRHCAQLWEKLELGTRDNCGDNYWHRFTVKKRRLSHCVEHTVLFIFTALNPKSDVCYKKKINKITFFANFSMAKIK